MKTYFEKLQDPRWQKKRLEVMQRDNFKCVSCGIDDVQLNIHHRYYVRGRDPWKYPMFCFKTLCKDCHQSEHNDEDQSVDTFETILEMFGIEDVCVEKKVYYLAQYVGIMESEGFKPLDVLGKIAQSWFEGREISIEIKEEPATTDP